jgi:hypothetical protein
MAALQGHPLVLPASSIVSLHPASQHVPVAHRASSARAGPPACAPLTAVPSTAVLQALVQAVNQCCDLVVRGGRQGLFNRASQVAAPGGAAAAGGRQGQQQQGMQGVGDALVYGFRKMLGV